MFVIYFTFSLNSLDLIFIGFIFLLILHVYLINRINHEWH